jgi:hypothetical protein
MASTQFAKFLCAAFEHKRHPMAYRLLAHFSANTLSAATNSIKELRSAGPTQLNISVLFFRLSDGGPPVTKLLEPVSKPVCRDFKWRMES